MKHRTFILLTLLLSTGALGCASAPKVARMVPTSDRLVFASTGKSIYIGEVKGGSETNPAWISKINGSDFRIALAQALEHSNLFTAVHPTLIGDYQLTAAILSQDQPLIGFALRVDLVIRYEIRDLGTREKVFDERIVSSYSAGMGEALMAVTRLRKANEGAVRENIRQFLERIASMELADRSH